MRNYFDLENVIYDIFGFGQEMQEIMFPIVGQI